MMPSTFAQSYDEWMEAVDRRVAARAGMSVHDLPDWLSRDAYDGGDTPDEGALLALSVFSYEE